MEFGPVQMLVLEFNRDRLNGEILPELERLREKDVIRLVDLVVVQKDESGAVTAVEASDLTTDEATEYGALVGALIGFGAAGETGAEIGAAAGAEASKDTSLADTGEVWYVADVIPDGSIAAIALIEHRWAIPLRDAVVRAGGVALADEWIHPEDLVALGAAAATTGG
jgi:uncharacterized membrane protein